MTGRNELDEDTKQNWKTSFTEKQMISSALHYLKSFYPTYLEAIPKFDLLFQVMSELS